AAAGTGFVFLAARPAEPAPVSAETVLMGALVFGCTAFAALEAGRASAAGGGAAGAAGGSRGSGRVAWTFTAPERGSLLATPALDGGRAYVACFLNPSPTARFGRLFALDLPPFGAPGTPQLKPAWEFDDDEGMKPMYCGPCPAGGRVYIGEGFHENGGCRMFGPGAAPGQEPAGVAPPRAVPTVSHPRTTP